MAKSIVYRLHFSDEDEDVIRELISIGFKALDICPKNNLKISYTNLLEEIATLAIEMVGVIYQDPHAKISQEEAEELITTFESSDHAHIIRRAFDVYRLANYPDSYCKFLICLQGVVGLGSVAVILTYEQLGFDQYSRALNRSHTLSREVWEAIYCLQNQAGEGSNE